MEWMGLMICLGVAVKMGILRVAVKKMKALTVKMETVMLIDRGGLNLTGFVLSV